MVLGAGACTGEIGGPTPPPPDYTNPLCVGMDPPPIAQPAPLRRLSREQYVNAVTDIVNKLAPAFADEILHSQEVYDGFTALADDQRATDTTEARGGFRRLDQDVEQDLVDQTFAVAQAVAADMTLNTQRVDNLLGACAFDKDTSNDHDCVLAFIQSAGRLILRRTLDQDDVDFYDSVYGADGIDAAGMADVLNVMLTSPYFLYQMEHGGDAVDADNNVYALDGQELANRLSLQFWDTIPDDTLQAKVDDGSILTDDGYNAALTYVTKSPLAQQSLGSFYRELLSLEDLEEMNRLVGTRQFDAIRGGFTPTKDTRENMIDDVTRLAVYYTAIKPNGTFADMFRTRRSFATTPDIAQIYNVGVWSGSGEPPSLPEAERVGILTRAGMVATGGPETRPVIKGADIRRILLCDDLPPPPANAMQVAQDTAAMLSEDMSTRAKTEALTQSRDDCAVCHANLINPLGFVTEDFDPLGRLRHTQAIFDDNGKALGNQPIDTSVVPQVVIGDTTTTVANAQALQEAMLASGKVQACFARKYFRFTFGKLDDPDKDLCTVDAVQHRLLEGQPLGQALFDLAKTPAFKQRRFN